MNHLLVHDDVADVDGGNTNSNHQNTNMEILIRIPPVLVGVWESLALHLSTLTVALSTYHDEVAVFLSQQRNVLGLVLSIVFFYPLWAYLVVAVTTASTWVFWLLASVVMGLIQMTYVTYQFIMIATDIFVLTLLKTYQTIMRSSAAQFIFFFSKRIQTSRQRLSRRKEWRKLCESVDSYGEYLRLNVWEKGVETDGQQDNTDADGDRGGVGNESADKSTSPKQDDELRNVSPLRKAFSFVNMETLKEERSSLEQQRHDRDWNLINSVDSMPPTKRLTNEILQPNNRDRENDVGGAESDSDSAPTPKTMHLKRQNSLSKLALLQKAQQGLDCDDGVPQGIKDDLGPSIATLLLSTTARLREERLAMRRGSGRKITGSSTASTAASSSSSAGALEFLLSGVVKRNHLTLEDLSVDNARSVALSGQYGFCKETRHAIDAYYDEVEMGLSCLVESPTDTGGSTASPVTEIQGRIKLLRKMKQNTGRTALMLSGGGAQAMYHLGTIRALIQSKLYRYIRVVSGTSGGSIAAACCACFTEDEIMNDICVSTVSTDFRRNGEMKKQNIRWFPPVADMISYWFENKLLVDSKYFFRTCEFYWGDITFAEAFEKTGKHVCIHVSASRASSGSAQRLLLNHISTPHVTLASAVAASCALPGVMKPRKLQAKNSLGKIEFFEVDGVEWIDGSVQADIPFQRISTLFNVSSYVVCQTNFHVLPFLNKEHHPHSKSKYWKLFQTIEWDIRNRVLKLSKLGLFPTFFGQDISKVFKQKYHGNITLVPRFTTMQTFGLAALVNPSERDMENYLKFGQIAAWPYLRSLRDMLRLEKALDEGLDRLKARLHELRPESDLSETADDDDVESIASSSVHVPHAQYVSAGRFVRFSAKPSSASAKELEMLRMKLSCAEEDNRILRQEAERLRSILSQAGIPLDDYQELTVAVADTERTESQQQSTSRDVDEDEKKLDGGLLSGLDDIIRSEGGVLNLVRRRWPKQQDPK